MIYQIAIQDPKGYRNNDISVIHIKKGKILLHISIKPETAQNSSKMKYEHSSEHF